MSEAEDAATETIQTPPQVGVYQLTAEKLELTTDLPGRTIAYRIAEVRPQVNGIVEERLFKEGAYVEKAEQLYQIDARPYQAQLIKAEAELAVAQQLESRYRELMKNRAISEQQYDEAYTQLKQAEADVEVAKINLQYTQLLSPISGKVSRSMVSEGALVMNGQPEPLATITQLDPIYVDVTQPVNAQFKLRDDIQSGLVEQTSNSTQVSLYLENGRRYPLTGTLNFSEVQVNPSTGAITLRAEFPNPDHLLLPGMFVHARIGEASQPAAILAPQQGITRDSRGEAIAYVVTDDNQVEMREVETIRTIGDRWLIGKGLSDGDQIITEGLHFVRHGLKVQPMPAKNVTPFISNPESK
ncbi:multidrug efflux RND transporter periplasmic adaptor subunit MexA [Wohlfahrtiimonas larvae]|uniref:Multidrug efflux RND transporter periplasmic adaptor subunit MexA n=2 Tax=Wohlfahrtiimonas larvae TaxID=1157986 RepID=A0ABP9MJY6_9GAMM